MTMFWPNEKVALRIVDDPSGEGFDPTVCPDYRVVEVTCDQIKDPDKADAIADELARLMGRPPIERTPEWIARSRALHAELFAGL